MSDIHVECLLDVLEGGGHVQLFAIQGQNGTISMGTR